LATERGGQGCGGGLPLGKWEAARWAGGACLRLRVTLVANDGWSRQRGESGAGKHCDKQEGCTGEAGASSPLAENPSDAKGETVFALAQLLLHRRRDRDDRRLHLHGKPWPVFRWTLPCLLFWGHVALLSAVPRTGRPFPAALPPRHQKRGFVRLLCGHGGPAAEIGLPVAQCEPRSPRLNPSRASWL
jgi:hypothetical protein